MTSFTLTGLVSSQSSSSNSFTYGIDYGGYFGPVGATLYDLPFSITWSGTLCNCSGSPDFNPITQAILEINSHTYTFTAGLAPYNSFYTYFQQVEVAPGNIVLSTWSMGNTPGFADGVFYIQECPPYPQLCDARPFTQAFLNISPHISAPGPITAITTYVPPYLPPINTAPIPAMGTGLLPLLLVAICIWKLCKLVDARALEPKP